MATGAMTEAIPRKSLPASSARPIHRGGTVIVPAFAVGPGAEPAVSSRATESRRSAAQAAAGLSRQSRWRSTPPKYSSRHAADQKLGPPQLRDLGRRCPLCAHRRGIQGAHRQPDGQGDHFGQRHGDRRTRAASSGALCARSEERDSVHRLSGRRHARRRDGGRRAKHQDAWRLCAGARRGPQSLHAVRPCRPGRTAALGRAASERRRARPSSSMASRRAPMRCVIRWKRKLGWNCLVPDHGQTVELVMSAPMHHACKARAAGNRYPFRNRGLPAQGLPGLPVGRFHVPQPHPALRLADRQVIATLYQVESDFLGRDEAGLSDAAWRALDLKEATPSPRGTHPPVEFLSLVRGRIYRPRAGRGRPSSTSFRTSSPGAIRPSRSPPSSPPAPPSPLSHDEICALTRAMVDVGERLRWDQPHHRRQAFRRRTAGQPHHAHHRGHRRRARADHAQDLVARHHLAGRHRRHDGDAGARSIWTRRAIREVVETRRRLHRLGRRGAAQPGRRHPDPHRARARHRQRRPDDRLGPVQEDRRGRDPSGHRHAGGTDRQGAQPERPRPR